VALSSAAKTMLSATASSPSKESASAIAVNCVRACSRVRAGPTAPRTGHARSRPAAVLSRGGFASDRVTRTDSLPSPSTLIRAVRRPPAADRAFGPITNVL
jgi:hypothetical protein